MQGRGVPSRAHLAGTTATLRGKNDDLGKTAPAQERGRGSGSGKDGLNPVQGPRASPPFPQLPYPDLHLSSTSASGCRPGPAPPTTNPALAWQSLGLATAGLLRPRRRFPQSQLGRALHPWPQAPPPQGSEWLSSGGAGEQKAANGRCEAGSGTERGGAPGNGCSGSAIAAGGAREPIPAVLAVCAPIYTSAGRVLAPSCVTWSPLEMPFRPCLPLSLW